MLRALAGSNSYFGLNRRDKDAPNASSVQATLEGDGKLKFSAGLVDSYALNVASLRRCVRQKIFAH